MFHLARGLASKKFVTPRDMAGFAFSQAKFALSGTEDLQDMATAVEAGLGFIAGRSIEELNALGEEIFTEYMVDKLWPGTLALAQQHLDAGEPVFLVTATPIELAQIIAERLGFTGALGTISETVGGIYTGRLAAPPLHGETKAQAVRALAEELGLELSECSAYSDSANDIPMLSSVGKPTAVNPDPELRHYARENGWQIKNYKPRKLITVGVPSAALVTAAAGVGVAVAIARARAKSPAAA